MALGLVCPMPHPDWLIGYLPGGQLAAAAPTFVAMSLGVNLMPVFLDHKMRTLPLQLPSDYYAVPVYKTCEDSEQGGTVTKGSAASFDGHEHHEHQVDMAMETDYVDKDPRTFEEIDV